MHSPLNFKQEVEAKATIISELEAEAKQKFTASMSLPICTGVFGLEIPQLIILDRSIRE